MMPLTLEELDTIRDDCRRMVSRRAAVSAGASLVPLPLADIGADIALLTEMIPAINHRFGLSLEQIERLDPHFRQVLLVAISSVGSELIGRYITKPLLLKVIRSMGLRTGVRSGLRLVPLAGQALAAGISYVAMRTLGHAHIDNCYRVAETAILAQMPEKAGVERMPFEPGHLKP